tara:strand:+ start:642 stop:1073 length:432 start_codon:yes stop_codon:yes gene_type:complete
VTNYDKEEIAFELLQWIPYCLPAEYDDDLAIVGYYSRTQKQRSDQAIDEWDKQHPYESSDELKAFKELERLGVYSPSDFYSPSKAQDCVYSKQLKNHTATAKGSNGVGVARGESNQGREGTRLDAIDEKQGFRFRRPRRRKRQ